MGTRTKITLEVPREVSNEEMEEMERILQGKVVDFDEESDFQRRARRLMSEPSYGNSNDYVLRGGREYFFEKDRWYDPRMWLNWIF